MNSTLKNSVIIFGILVSSNKLFAYSSIEPLCEAREYARCYALATGSGTNDEINRYTKVAIRTDASTANRLCQHPHNFWIAHDCTQTIDLDKFSKEFKETMTVTYMKELIRREDWFAGKEDKMEKILSELQMYAPDSASPFKTK
ncbi:MAG: hypothetical protein JWQ35_1974 [Bacteriovoracaceae bacterium]|nr:hypothetical protein [Bacteriovoracaceae bacterium]